jgi:hypothetical protein
VQIEIDVAKFYDQETRHQSQLTGDDDEIAVPSPHGKDLYDCRVLRHTPNTTYIAMPDSDIDLMESTHRAGVMLARKGYVATQEGGPLHDQEVTVPPRALPLRSRNELIANHLRDAVMPDHAPGEHIRRVRIVTPYRNPEGVEEDPAVTRKLERYLNAVMAQSEDEERPVPVGDDRIDRSEDDE